MITAVILDMYGNNKVGHEFLSSMAIGGVDGTLWARFRDADTVGRIRGKTGSLNGVFCLAGIVEGGDGDVYAFALLTNELGSSTWPVKRLMERFGDAMVGLGGAATGGGGSTEDSVPSAGSGSPVEEGSGEPAEGI